jgi:hypothetical protein
MTPTCSNAAMRVLISVLLASTVANAAALPHQVVDARAPAPIQNAELAAQAIQAAASAAAENPTNFFEDVSEELNNRTGWEVFRDFFTRLFGPREGDEPAEVTVTVTASAEVTVSAVPATTTVEIVLPSIPLTTGTSESEIIFSIMPIGDLTSMINATIPTPVFVTATDPAATTSAVAISAPFPVLNGTASDSILPTAVSITGQFSVNMPLVTGIPSPVNSTIPAGTGIALPTAANGTDIAANATVTANIPTTIVVTETVTPVLILTTGTAVSASAGLPIPVEASPIWGNGTYGQPTAITIGSGIFVGTGTAALSIVPVETALPLGTGIPLVTGTGVPLVTGTGSLVLPTDVTNPLYSNTTTVSAAILPFPILVTGVPAVVVNLTAPTANVTTITPTASFTQIPILVTGTPDGVLINVTLTPPANETLAAPLNTTASVTSIVEPAASLTEHPFTVTGAPGMVLNVSVTIPAGVNVNVSSTALPVSITSTVSVGTGLPIPSIDATAAPFINSTTTVNATEVVIASSATVVPSAGTLSFVFPPLSGGN